MARYFHAEGIGTIRALTSTDGTPSDRYVVESFGGIVLHDGVDPSPYLFSGEMQDSYGSGVYLRDRWYHPASGRFASPDRLKAIWRAQRVESSYLYAGNDPLDASDPTGLFTRHFGNRVHELVSERYVQEQGADGVFLDEPLGFGCRPKLRPDILDSRPHRRKFMEIKPFSFRGLACGVPQLAGYQLVLSEFGFEADAEWTPQPQPLWVEGQPLYVVNFGGLLLYTDAETVLEELAAAAAARNLSVLYRLLRQFKASGSAINELAWIRRMAAMNSVASQAQQRQSLFTGVLFSVF